MFARKSGEKLTKTNLTWLSQEIGHHLLKMTSPDLAKVENLKSLSFLCKRPKVYLCSSDLFLCTLYVLFSKTGHVSSPKPFCDLRFLPIDAHTMCKILVDITLQTDIVLAKRKSLSKSGNVLTQNTVINSPVEIQVTSDKSLYIQ